MPRKHHFEKVSYFKSFISKGFFHPRITQLTWFLLCLVFHWLFFSLHRVMWLWDHPENPSKTIVSRLRLARQGDQWTWFTTYAAQTKIDDAVGWEREDGRESEGEVNKREGWRRDEAGAGGGWGELSFLASCLDRRGVGGGLGGHVRAKSLKACTFKIFTRLERFMNKNYLIFLLKLFSLLFSKLKRMWQTWELIMCVCVK